MVCLERKRRKDRDFTSSFPVFLHRNGRHPNPGAANGWTLRDGSALAGLFDGKELIEIGDTQDLPDAVIAIDQTHARALVAMLAKLEQHAHG